MERSWPPIELIDTFAAILWDIWDNYDEDSQKDYYDDERAQKFWRGCLEVLEKDPSWSGGKHSGDCTKVPMTCMRCFVDDKRRDAKKLLIAMKKLGYLAR